MKYLALLCCLAFLIGCTVEAASERPSRSATPANEVNDNANVDSTSNVIVIDVRSQQEWDSGHVDQALHIPHTEIADRIGEVTEDKTAPIVLYCAVGGRAGKAKTALEELGYTNVENGGGYKDVKDRFE